MTSISHHAGIVLGQLPSPPLPSPPPSNAVGIYSNSNVVDQTVVENLVYDLYGLGFSPILLNAQPTNWSNAPPVYIIPCCPGYPNASISTSPAVNLYSNTEPKFQDLSNYVARGGLLIVLQGEYYDNNLFPSNPSPAMASLNSNLLNTNNSNIGFLDATNIYYGKMMQTGGWPGNFTIPTTYSTHWYLGQALRRRSLQSIPSNAAWPLYAVNNAASPGSSDPVVTATQPIISGSTSIGYLAWLGCDWAVSEGSVTGPWTIVLSQIIKTFSIQALYPAPQASPSPFPSSPPPPPPPFPPLPPGSYPITAYAGTGSFGSTGDGGPATLATFSTPSFMAFDPLGNYLAIADSGNAVVRKVNVATGIITTQSTGLSTANGLAFDTSSNLYVSDSTQSIIIKVDAITNQVTTFAGIASGSGYTGDYGKATSAQLYGPIGLTVYRNILYVADSMNNCIRAIDLSTNIINTVVGDGVLSRPVFIAFDSGDNMFISDNGNMVIRRVDALSSIISTFAGNGSEAYAGESMLLSSPLAVSDFSCPQEMGCLQTAQALEVLTRSLSTDPGATCLSPAMS